MDDVLNVKLVIYKRIVAGDLRKFTATSNDSQTGGGARDLRYSPVDEFFPKFEMMFPNNINGILHGQLNWSNHAPTSVEIHPPTSKRPNEMRIAKVHECIPSEFFPKDDNDTILIFILDDSNKVWPYFITESSLIHDGWHPKIRDNILNGLNAKRRSNTSPMGYIDLVNGGIYTNGT